MKTSLLKSVMSVAMVAVAMFLGVSQTANAADGKTFVRNDDGDVKEVYSLNADGLTLTREMRYEYTRDESGRITNKKAFRWDSEAGKWAPYYLIAIHNDEVQTEVELFGWNSKTHGFDRAIERAVYSLDPFDGQLVALHRYQMNSDTKRWEISGSLLLEEFLAQK